MTSASDARRSAGRVANARSVAGGWHSRTCIGLLGLIDENSQVAEVEAQTRKRRALEAIKRILLRESLNQPLIVIFEDFTGSMKRPRHS